MMGDFKSMSAARPNNTEHFNNVRENDVEGEIEIKSFLKLINPSIGVITKGQGHLSVVYEPVELIVDQSISPNPRGDFLQYLLPIKNFLILDSCPYIKSVFIVDELSG
jgi:hypothetical protein